MKLVLINYGAGNTQSLAFAFERLGVEPILSNKSEDISSADLVVFPGVGHAKSAMEALKQSKLDSVIPSLKQPVLGICLGMQLMNASSSEGNTKGLGIFPEHVSHFDHNLKIPHMGWNEVFHQNSPRFEGIDSGALFYHVHSYFVSSSTEYSIAECTYGQKFCTAMQKSNFFGVQFHPEKSGFVGSKLLENFLKMH